MLENGTVITPKILSSAVIIPTAAEAAAPLCRAAFPDDAAQQRDQRTGEHNGIADRKKINNICKRKRAYNGCHRNNNIDDEIQALLLLFRCILINKAAVQVMNNKRIRRHQLHHWQST